MGLPPLPIDAYIGQIVATLRTHRALVVTAAPGAGKTTRVPPALVDDGPVLLLQPRRVAARSIARRIAAERGWTAGREVGWHVRHERRFSTDTRLLVATEGILTARLQQDPLLTDFRSIVIDEFHERSIHADLGLALAKQAWIARPDLRLVVMSATLDAARVAAFLDGCPVIDVPGRLHPVSVAYRPGEEVADAVASEARNASGAVLAFLPGAPEIRRTAERLRSMLPEAVPVLPLHGALDPDEQDAALVPSAAARVILATNIAETTLTVPDVRVVVDAGLQKLARYDAARGIDSLETERISLDAADQRAGRAGRVSAGRAVRLWDPRDRLRPHREPDISRVDLAGVALEVIAWGGDPRRFEWFEAPRSEALAAALDLLQRLDAVDADLRLTGRGASMRQLPLHPRLARLLLDAGGTAVAARVCALLSERHFHVPASHATSCDLLAAAERDLPGHVTQVARDLRERARDVLGKAAADAPPDEEQFRRSVLAAYPDRVAERRASGSDRLLLASGTGARLGRESGVLLTDLLVAVDVTAAPLSRGAADRRADGGAAAEAIVRMATAIERDWLRPTSSAVEHLFDEAAGIVRAFRIDRYGAIVLNRAACEVDPEVRRQLVAEAATRRGPTAEDRELLSRLAFAGLAMPFDELVAAATVGATRLADMDIASALPHDVRRALDRDAPVDLALPTGRRARLVYGDDGRVRAAVKLQELFGLGDTPRIGPRRTPVTFELLAPNGRPVQVTSDLRSFWNTGYAEVRRQLRGRYPKHPWPDDPWTAAPTHKTKKST